MIKNIYKKTKEAISNFSSDPINNLAFIIPVFIGLITFLSGILTYFMFILKGGYGNQASAIGAYGGFDEKFTTGTTGLITSGIVGKIIFALVCVEFILMMINYFRNSGKAKRIVMIVDMVILVIQIILTVTVFGIAIGKLVINQEDAYEALKPFEGITINVKTLFITYGVISLVSIIVFIVLIKTSMECRCMVKNTVISLGISYIGIPLFFLVLENIVSLATSALTIIFVCGILFLVLKIFVGGASEGGGSSSGARASHSGSSSRGDNYSTDFAKVEKGPKQEVQKYDLNTTFWRDKGGCGAWVPRVDCIYYKNMWGEKKYACTVEDFEKGKVVILNKGNRIMNVAGCKTPER